LGRKLPVLPKFQIILPSIGAELKIFSIALEKRMVGFRCSRFQEQIRHRPQKQVRNSRKKIPYLIDIKGF
jgi:hypothetical protein